MLKKIRKSKDYLLEALVKTPQHHHRDPSMFNSCDHCLARKNIENAYKSLPSNQEIKAFEERLNGL